MTKGTPIRLRIAVLVHVLLSTTSSMASDEGLTFKEYLEKANDNIKAYRHFEAGDALKEATRLGGAEHPSLHMRLAILYYGLGLIPEAIAEGEKAVSLAPSSKWYKYDLAKFYFVDKQYNKAEDQLINLLRIDPGFTFGYYYLAELYFRKKQYDLAWLSMRRAKLLGYQGKHLEEMLASSPTKPEEDLDRIANRNMLFRFMRLSSAEEAATILDELRKGKLFENLEFEVKNENSSEADFGVMQLSELQETVAEPLRKLRPYAPPVIIQTGRDYRIMQRILPFDPASWTATRGSASPSPPEKQQLSAEIAASYVLEDWRNAWETADINGYFAAYSKSFSPPEGITLASWKELREKSLTRPKAIKIKIGDPVIEALPNNQLLITFKQSYESDTYRDVVTKALTLVKETAGWKIINERIVKQPIR